MYYNIISIGFIVQVKQLHPELLFKNPECREEPGYRTAGVNLNKILNFSGFK